MKYLSLFSGIGGFELGIQQAYENNRPNIRNRAANIRKDLPNIEERKVRPTCIGFSEIDKYAIQIYQKHFPNHKNYGDITQLQWEELPDFELLVGGFPCQAFSIAGKRKGFEDTRGTLFFDIAKGLRVKQPDFALLENVKGLVSHDKGKTLEIILETLQELGYYSNIEIHNSKDHGVPQNRERVFFICRHIKTLIKDGQSLNLNTSRQIISEYLFQILLNNLVEVKKLQEIKSKDWVIGYLLSKEINENLLSHDTNESTKDGITIPTAENKSLFQEGGVWQNIATWLNSEWEDDSKEKNKSTTLTAIKEIINQKTYTYFQMQKAILLAIVLLRNYYPNLWKEVLSDLIVIKESTKYVRINDFQTKEVIVSESGNAYLTKDIKADEQFIAFANLRGTPRPQVFPFGEATRATDERLKQDNTEVTSTLRSRYGNGTGSHIKQLNQPTHSNDRVYGTEGVSPTLNTMQGGNRQPFIQNPKMLNYKKDYESSVSITATSYKEPPVVNAIRRLTPTECERLQGFPDGWTEGVSDTQRYKTLGNAVTVNVIRDICERLLLRVIVVKKL